MSDNESLSRRGFLRSALAAGAGAALLKSRAEAQEATPDEGLRTSQADSEALSSVAVACTINGEARQFEVDPDETTLELLRRRCDLTGAKLGCGAGTCGACTIDVNGRTMVTCLLPATALEGKSVRTVEGLAGEHPVQRAFAAEDALQCGYCTPGFVVEAAHFVDSWRRLKGDIAPSRDDVAAALAGHLCRCGAYERIYAAVQAACIGAFDTGTLDGPRQDAAPKLTGAAKYTVDHYPPGVLEGRIVRSPVAHGRLRSATPPSGTPWVQLVPDGSILRYVGQEIGVITAETPAMARALAAAVTLDIEELPAAITTEKARAPGAPLVYADKQAQKDTANASEGPAMGASWDGNLRGPFNSHLFGKPGKADKDATLSEALGTQIEGTWQTHVQSHTALEPHAAVAQFSGETLEVWASTQSVHYLAEDLAQTFDLDADQVVVHAEFVGGGFGAKVGLQMEVLAACRAAQATGRPVRVVLDRHEELMVGGMRPGVTIELALSSSEDGEITAVQSRGYGDSGVAVASNTGMLMRLLYPSPKRLEDFDVVTHTPPGKPFRGPGGPPAYFALEGAVDRLAEQRDEDPLDLRRRWDPNPPRQALYDWAQSTPIWRRRRVAATDQGRFQRGIGASAGGWFQFIDPKALVGLKADASGFKVQTASQDMGNGTRSLLAFTIAQTLGVDPSAIQVRVGHSDAPYGPMSAGSRTAASLAPAAVAAANALMEDIADAAKDLGLEGTPGPGGLVTESGETIAWADILKKVPPIEVVGKRPKNKEGYFLPLFTGSMKIGKSLPGAVCMVEVEVDRWFGRVRVLEAWSGLGVGKRFVPALATSQAEGGLIQGLSYALFEERRLDPNTGRLLTHNLDDYRIAGMGDIGKLHTHFVDEGFEEVAEGGVGVGEICTVAVAAAVANAVHNATGVRPYRLPLNPEQLLKEQA